MIELLTGDVRVVLRALPAESVHCAVTSPPYWNLRDYGTESVIWGGDATCQHIWKCSTQPSRVRTPEESAGDSSWKQRSSTGSISVGLDSGKGYLCENCDAWLGSLGMEPTADMYVAHLVEVFRELRRVLRQDGLFWLNLGDTFRYGQCNMVPARVALAMQADGWLLRSEVVWAKPSPMPESVKNRCTRSHEMLYMFSRSGKYFFDMEAIKEPAVGGCDWGLLRGRDMSHPDKVSWHARSIRNRQEAGVDSRIAGTGFRHKRDVWWLSTELLKDEHYAAFPTKLVEPCVLASTSERGVCLKCGKPWERVVERKPMVIPRSGRGEMMGKWGRTQASGTMTKPASAITLGFRPICKCPEHPPILATVLDPFSGAGTTGIVCSRTGRNYIGIDLKSEYHDICRRRLEHESEKRKTKLSSAENSEGVGEICEQTTAS